MKMIKLIKRIYIKQFESTQNLMDETDTGKTYQKNLHQTIRIHWKIVLRFPYGVWGALKLEVNLGLGIRNGPDGK
jgi:hypothetical protein